MQESAVYTAFDLYNDSRVPTDNILHDHIALDFANVPCSTSLLDEINFEEDACQTTNFPEGQPISHRARTKLTCSTRINKTSSSGGVKKDRVNRRENASIRERNRLHVLNDALHMLRNLVPDARTKERVTKLQILRMASRYILQLREILEENTRNNGSDRVENELKSCLFSTIEPTDTNALYASCFDNHDGREFCNELESRTSEAFLNSIPQIIH